MSLHGLGILLLRNYINTNSYSKIHRYKEKFSVFYNSGNENHNTLISDIPVSRKTKFFVTLCSIWPSAVLLLTPLSIHTSTFMHLRKGLLFSLLYITPVQIMALKRQFSFLVFHLSYSLFLLAKTASHPLHTLLSICWPPSIQVNHIPHATHFDPEDQGSTLLWNSADHLPGYMLLQPRTPQSE